MRTVTTDRAHHVLRVACLVVMACRSSDSFTIGTELGLPKPYDGLRPRMSLDEAKRLVPALEKPERIDQDGRLVLDGLFVYPPATARRYASPGCGSRRIRPRS